MPSMNRAAPGNMVFDALNRGLVWQRLVDKLADNVAFEEDLDETLGKGSDADLYYCIMPNHWQLVLWPEHQCDLAVFIQRLTVTHVTR